MTPAVVMRPSLLPVVSVNQRLPSGPAVMASGPEPVAREPNWAMTPEVEMRPIWETPTLFSTNQRLPSGPAVMPAGLARAAGTANDEMLRAGARRSSSASRRGRAAPAARRTEERRGRNSQDSRDMATPR